MTNYGSAPPTVHRSLLFVPGHRESMLAGAAARPADAIVFDLEDSVSSDQKANARERVSAILRSWPSDAPAPCVRINSPRRGEVEQDLAVVLSHAGSSVLIPKVDRPEEIHGVLAAVGAREVMINIETPRALLRALDFADLHGVTALFLGGEDLTLELGMKRTAASNELLSARFMLLCAARAAGIAAYDTICPDFRDLDVVEADSVTAMELGFDGKFAIHPAQLEVINRVFTPTDADVAQAERVVAAYDNALANGDAAVALDGQMIDPPVAERARAVVSRAGRLRRGKPSAPSA